MSVGRELDRAEQAGLVASHRADRNRSCGSTRLIRGGRPLWEVVLVTFGAPHVVAEEYGLDVLRRERRP